MQLVYFIHSPAQGTVKIGQSTLARVDTRLSTLQTGNSDELVLLCTLPAVPIDLEFRLHSLFHDDYIRGEWFRYSKAIQDYIANPYSLPSTSTESLLSVLSTDVWMTRADIANALGKPKLKSWEGLLLQRWTKDNILLEDRRGCILYYRLSVSSVLQSTPEESIR